MLDPLPTPEPVEQGEDPDDVTAFCFGACNDMVACSFGLLGGAPAICFPAFQACPEEFMAACEPASGYCWPPAGLLML